jgi:hypothetical protein
MGHPVILRHSAEYNELIAPGISTDDRGRLFGEIPVRERHRRIALDEKYLFECPIGSFLFRGLPSP